MTTPARIHDNYSASKMARILACPGSVLRSQGIPEPEGDTSARDRGTRIHDLCEAMGRGQQLSGDAEEVRLAGLLFQAGEEAASPYLTVGHVTTYEVEVELTRLGIERPGFIDRLWFDPENNLVVILDYKSGSVPVTAQDNAQMATYAVGVSYEFDVARVVVLIAQPDFDGEPRVSVWDMDAQALDRWEDRIRAGVDYARYGGAPLVPGDHCKYCHAREVCEARRGPLHLLPAIESVDQHLSQLDAQGRARFLDALEEAADWSKNALTRAKRFCQVTETPVDGWKIKPGKKSRGWKPEAQTQILAHLRTADLPETVLLETSMKSVAVVEKEKLVPKEWYEPFVAVTAGEPTFGRAK